jgi:hypothetical protein
MPTCAPFSQVRCFRDSATRGCLKGTFERFAFCILQLLPRAFEFARYSPDGLWLSNGMHFQSRCPIPWALNEA